MNQDSLEIKRLLDASPERVFNAWTDPEIIKRWWGPKGFTTPHCNIDLKEGGAFHSCMRSPEGKEYWGIGYFQEIKEPERLVFTDSFSDEKGNIVSAEEYGMSANWPKEALVTVNFKPHSDNKTELRLEHKGIPKEDMEPCKEGWSQSLDKLEEELKK